MSEKTETQPNLKVLDGGLQGPAQAPEVAADDLSAVTAPTEFAAPLNSARRTWDLGAFGSPSAEAPDVGAEVLQKFVLGATADAASTQIMTSPVAREVLLPKSTFMGPAFEELRRDAIRAVVQGAEDAGVMVGAGTRNLLAAA